MNSNWIKKYQSKDSYNLDFNRKSKFNVTSYVCYMSYYKHEDVKFTAAEYRVLIYILRFYLVTLLTQGARLQIPYFFDKIYLVKRKTKFLDKVVPNEQKLKRGDTFSFNYRYTLSNFSRNWIIKTTATVIPTKTALKQFMKLTDLQLSKLPVWTYKKNNTDEIV